MLRFDRCSFSTNRKRRSCRVPAITTSTRIAIETSRAVGFRLVDHDGCNVFVHNGEPAPRTGGGEGRAFQAQTGGAGRHGRGTRQLRCDRSWRADAVRPVGANIPVETSKTARWNDWYWRNSRFPRSAANGSKGTDMTRSPSPPVRAASCAKLPYEVDHAAAPIAGLRCPARS